MEITYDETPPIEPGDEPTVLTGERICLTCGLPIPDELSGGRRRKYHDGCRPSKQVNGSGSSGKRTNIDTLMGQIGDLYRNVGIGLAFVPSMALDGMVVAGEADKLAESWRPLIEKDPKIRKAWERITTGSGWGTVIMAHAGIGLQIASHHGVKLPGVTKAPTAPPQSPDQGTNQ